MPLLPTGLTAGLYDRIVERVKQELGGKPGTPASTPPGVTTPQSPDPGFLARIKQIVQQRLSKPDAAPEWRDLGPPTDLADLKWRLQFAARQNPPRILSLTYHNQTRDVEPYSYRYRARDEPHIPLFFAFCAKDDSINSFLLQKVQDCQITNRTYVPRWLIEI